MSTKSLLILISLGLIAACSQHQRTEAILPPIDVRGAESSSSSLYSKGTEGATTAMGQIFLPPTGHTLLIKVGFLCRHAPGGYNRALDANVKLRVSQWAGDRPASTPLWESDAVLVKSDINGWLFFDVPHLKLISGQKYIAWLTMSGEQNADDASFGVVNLGPWTTTQRKPNEPWQPNNWTSDYPEGARTFWRGSNPDGQVSLMTESPWITEASGQNLHFKMVFENIKPSKN